MRSQTANGTTDCLENPNTVITNGIMRSGALWNGGIPVIPPPGHSERGPDKGGTESRNLINLEFAFLNRFLIRLWLIQNDHKRGLRRIRNARKRGRGEESHYSYV